MNFGCVICFRLQRIEKDHDRAQDELTRLRGELDKLKSVSTLIGGENRCIMSSPIPHHIFLSSFCCK